MGIGGWKPWEWVRWKLTTQSQNSENSACTGPRPRATAHGPVYGFTLHSKWFLVRVETADPLYHILPHTLKIPHSSHPWSLSTPAVPVARKPRPRTLSSSKCTHDDQPRPRGLEPRRIEAPLAKPASPHLASQRSMPSAPSRLRYRPSHLRHGGARCRLAPHPCRPAPRECSRAA